MGSLLYNLFYNNTIVISVIKVRLTPENYITLLEIGHYTVTITLFFILEFMLNYPFKMDSLIKLKHIAYTGKPLNLIRGQVLANRLPHLFTILASIKSGIKRFISINNNFY